MKIVFSENLPLYSEYLFPYSIYALRKEDPIDGMYEAGFIPTRIRKDLYYLARGSRIDLGVFEPSSENRRVKRKVEDLSIELVSLKKFDYDYTIGKLAKDFYDAKFGKGTMSAQKMKWIFTSGAYTHVFVYSLDGKIVGYCPLICNGTLIHYAYPFYDLSIENPNMGMGMMLSAIEHAKETRRKYVYLGTVYTETSLYKTQFKGFQYFTGWKWSSDVKALKSLIRDGQPTNMFMELELEKKDEVLESTKIDFTIS